MKLWLTASKHQVLLLNFHLEQFKVNLLVLPCWSQLSLPTLPGDINGKGPWAWTFSKAAPTVKPITGTASKCTSLAVAEQLCYWIISRTCFHLTCVYFPLKNTPLLSSDNLT